MTRGIGRWAVGIDPLEGAESNLRRTTITNLIGENSWPEKKAVWIFQDVGDEMISDIWEIWESLFVSVSVCVCFQSFIIWNECGDYSQYMGDYGQTSALFCRLRPKPRNDKKHRGYVRLLSTSIILQVFSRKVRKRFSRVIQLTEHTIWRRHPRLLPKVARLIKCRLICQEGGGNLLLCHRNGSLAGSGIISLWPEARLLQHVEEHFVSQSPSGHSIMIVSFFLKPFSSQGPEQRWTKHVLELKAFACSHTSRAFWMVKQWPGGNGKWKKSLVMPSKGSTHDQSAK